MLKILAVVLFLSCTLIEGRSLQKRDDLFSSPGRGDGPSYGGQTTNTRRFNEAVHASGEAKRSLPLPDESNDVIANDVLKRLDQYYDKAFDSVRDSGRSQSGAWTVDKRESPFNVQRGPVARHSVRFGDGLGSVDKKAFDSISGVSGFGGFKKRSFDSISGMSDFGGFKKRGPETTNEEGRSKKSGKRSFDSISGVSDFGGFGKRSFDSIEHRSFFGGFGKRSFDSIGHQSAFGGLQKRAAVPDDSNDMNRRSFDSIAYMSNFGGFGNAK